MPTELTCGSFEDPPGTASQPFNSPSLLRITRIRRIRESVVTVRDRRSYYITRVINDEAGMSKGHIPGSLVVESD